MKRNILIKKIIIGSANFTQKYGADLKQINNKEIRKILKIAKKNNISKIDTAENYIKNKTAFNSIDKNFTFFSKIKPNSKWVSLKYCQKKIDKHFQIFNSCIFETLLIHDIKILFTKSGQKIFKNLEKLKERKYFKKIGISIYDTKCLDYLIYKYKFDVVQCPFNIFDRRIITSGWFKKLKKKKIEIHVRSIFLQGLIVNENIFRKKYFKKWEGLFVDWFKYLKTNKISPIDFCMSDLLNYRFDKVIVGINSSENLKDILNFKIIGKNKMINFKINDKMLIDPRNWK